MPRKIKKNDIFTERFSSFHPEQAYVTYSFFLATHETTLDAIEFIHEHKDVPFFEKFDHPWRLMGHPISFCIYSTKFIPTLFNFLKQRIIKKQNSANHILKK